MKVWQNKYIRILKGTDMGIYAISDLHLAKSIEKPMDIFGNNWVSYMEKIEENWLKTIGHDDFVIIPGDLSWATYLKDAFDDFSFMESLPGTKLILKGNHDYWWTTHKKINEFCFENDFKSLVFLQNQSYIIDDAVICGTRGWIKSGTKEGIKIYNREIERLKLSLMSVKDRSSKRIIVALHYPPFDNEGNPNDFVDIMNKYDVDICVFGHLHNLESEFYINYREKKPDFKLISADYIDFKPVRLV
jgi:predicted phosphohydrolase